MSPTENTQESRNESNAVETPFECSFGGCNARYRRKEHLQRHQRKHASQEPFRCSHCERSFGRSDTLRRHLRQHHKIHEPTNRAPRACEGCHAAKSRCEGGLPCDECLRKDITCNFKELDAKLNLKPIETEGTNTIDSHTPDLLVKRDQCIELYFEKFHPHWSFIHRGSFHAPREIPLMVQTMVVIGLWATGEPSSQSAAKELHNKLDAAIHEQTEKWDASDCDEASSSCHWPLATFQAILLHILFSCMIESKAEFNFRLNVSVGKKTTDLLSALVRSCRKLGLFYFPNIVAQYRDSGHEILALIFIEETKRFNLALYRLGKKLSYSDIGQNDLAPELSNGDFLINADELKFPLPKGKSFWNAMTRMDWNLAVPAGSERMEVDDFVEESWISASAELLDYL